MDRDTKITGSAIDKMQLRLRACEFSIFRHGDLENYIQTNFENLKQSMGDLQILSLELIMFFSLL